MRFALLLAALIACDNGAKRSEQSPPANPALEGSTAPVVGQPPPLGKAPEGSATAEVIDVPGGKASAGVDRGTSVGTAVGASPGAGVKGTPSGATTGTSSGASGASGATTGTSTGSASATTGTSAGAGTGTSASPAAGTAVDGSNATAAPIQGAPDPTKVSAATKQRALDPTNHLRDEQGTLTVTSPSTTAGSPATAEIKLVPAKGWHVATNYPIKLWLEPPAGVQLDKSYMTAGGRSETRGDAAVLSEQALHFTVKATPATAGAFSIRGVLSFGICDPESCHPRTQPITIQVAAK